MVVSKVTIPENLIIEGHQDYNALIDWLATQAIKRGATTINNGYWTVTYLIQSQHITIDIVLLILSVGGDVEDFPLHHTSGWEEQVKRVIDGVTWYEHWGKVSEMGIDVSTAKTDTEINALLAA